MTMPYQTQSFLDVTFEVADEAEFIDGIGQWARDPQFRYVVTPNVDHMIRLHQDPSHQDALWQAYRAAALTINDSRILSRLARHAGLTLPAVPGSDMTASVLRDPAFHGLHFHVIGGLPETLEYLKTHFTQVRWTQFIPPANVRNDPLAQAAIVQSVVAQGAQVTFMAIGSPQSEIVCHQLLAQPDARGVALCIGASLEFVTGEKRRAPQVVQRLGLEWLFRLLSEPRRLWRRYIIVAPKIFLIYAAWKRRRGQEQHPE